MTMTVNNVDQGELFLTTPEAKDDLLTFGGAGTEVAGTILARDSVSGKAVPFVKGGATNENGIPKLVLISDATATGAGDVSVRVARVARCNKRFLVIKADGDDTNIDEAVKDQLRDYGILVFEPSELRALDNQ
jgi:hypothetical protein